MTLHTLDADPACPPAVEAQPLVRPPRSGSRLRRGSVAGSSSVGHPSPRSPLRRGMPSPPAARTRPRSAAGRSIGPGGTDTGRRPTRTRSLIEDPALPAGSAPVAIVPLMHRHEVEPDEADRRSTIRHGNEGPLTPVEPTAKAVFFGASYHADYATILAAPADLPAVATALVDHLGRPSAIARRPSDALGCRGPAPPALRGPGLRRPDRCVPRRSRDLWLDGRSRARGRLPGRRPSRRASTSRAISTRSRRRPATRSGARSAGPRPPGRWSWSIPPTRRRTWQHSSTCTSGSGASAGCSRPMPAATRAGSSSDGCSRRSDPRARSG